MKMLVIRNKAFYSTTLFITCGGKSFPSTRNLQNLKKLKSLLCKSF